MKNKLFLAICLLTMCTLTYGYYRICDTTPGEYPPYYACNNPGEYPENLCEYWRQKNDWHCIGGGTAEDFCSESSIPAYAEHYVDGYCQHYYDHNECKNAVYSGD